MSLNLTKPPGVARIEANADVDARPVNCSQPSSWWRAFSAYRAREGRSTLRGGYYSGCGQWGGVDGVHGVPELAGARAIRISTARVAVGCTFERGVTGHRVIRRAWRCW